MGHKRSEVHFLKPDSLLPIHADCERRCGMLARADDALTALNYFAFAGEFYAVFPCFESHGKCQLSRSYAFTQCGVETGGRFSW